MTRDWNREIAQTIKDNLRRDPHFYDEPSKQPEPDHDHIGLSFEEATARLYDLTHGGVSFEEAHETMRAALASDTCAICGQTEHPHSPEVEVVLAQIRAGLVSIDEARHMMGLPSR